MSERRREEPLEPELQQEDARGPDGAERQYETRQGADQVQPPEDEREARAAADRSTGESDDASTVGPRGEVRHGDVPHDPEPEGVERFNRSKKPVDETPDQPEATDPPDNRVRASGQGPSKSVDFDENEAVPHREEQKGAAVPGLATGMFFPVAILLIVGIVVILWFVL